MTDNDRKEPYAEFALKQIPLQSSFSLQQMQRNLRNQDPDSPNSLILSAIREAVEKELDKRIKSCRPF